MYVRINTILVLPSEILEVNEIGLSEMGPYGTCTKISNVYSLK